MYPQTGNQISKELGFVEDVIKAISDQYNPTEIGTIVHDIKTVALGLIQSHIDKTRKELEDLNRFLTQLEEQRSIILKESKIKLNDEDREIRRDDFASIH